MNHIKIADAYAKKQGFVTVQHSLAIEMPVDEDTRPKEPFTPEQVDTVLAYIAQTPGVATPVEWKTMILLAYYGGLRLDDARMLTWDHVSFAPGHEEILYIAEKTNKRGTKIKKVIQIPLHNDLLNHLMAYAGDSSGPLCPTLCAKHETDVCHLFGSILDHTTIDRGTIIKNGRKSSLLTFHSLRHSFVTRLVEAGVSEETRMSLAGHSTVTSHQKYNHAKNAGNVAAIKKLERLRPEKQNSST